MQYHANRIGKKDEKPLIYNVFLCLIRMLQNDEMITFLLDQSSDP